MVPRERERERSGTEKCIYLFGNFFHIFPRQTGKKFVDSVYSTFCEHSFVVVVGAVA